MAKRPGGGGSRGRQEVAAPQADDVAALTVGYDAPLPFRGIPG